MKITTNNSEKYENEINKYFSHKKKWDYINKAVKTLSWTAFIFLVSFYCLVAIYIGFKLFNKDTSVIVYMITGSLVLAFLFLIISVLMQIKSFSMSTRAKLWNAYINAKKKGYEPIDIELWFDTDKIYSHIIFMDKDNKKSIYFIRLDEFFVKSENIEEPEIRLDEFEIVIPEGRQKMIHNDSFIE